MTARIFLKYILVFGILVLPTTSYAGSGCGGGGGGGGRRGSAEGESEAMKKQRLAVAYKLGERIIAGKVVLRPRIPELAKQQARALSAYTNHLSQETIDGVAGRLSREEFFAARHYLATRYPASTVDAEEVRAARWREEQASLERARFGYQNKE